MKKRLYADFRMTLTFMPLKLAQENTSIPRGKMSLRRMIKSCVFQEPKKLTGVIIAIRGPWALRY